MKTIMLVFMFFMIGALFIISEHNLHIGDKEDLSKLSKFYTSWLDSSLENLKTIAGHVIRLDWLPVNNSTR